MNSPVEPAEPLRILGPWPSLIQVRAEKMRRSFAEFVREAWAWIDPNDLEWTEVTNALCIALQAVAEGKIRNLVINIPPGFAKSMIVSVLWPAWRWARDPRWQVIGGSYDEMLSTRDATKSRELMNSDWYVRHFRSGRYAWGYKKDQDAKTFYVNTKGGHRVATSVDGRGTGHRCDCEIIDDPLKAKDAYSELKREGGRRWFFETLASRFNNKRTGERVIIMQRLHEDDLTGHVLRANGLNGVAWQHLFLPLEFDPVKACVLKTDAGVELWRDPRTQAGESLWPSRFGVKEFTELKNPFTGLGSFMYAAQYLQIPVPAEGGYIKRRWFARRWVLPGVIMAPQNMVGLDPPVALLFREVPTKFMRVWAFVDCAFKKLEDSDRVAIGVFGQFGPDLFLLELAWRRMSFTETVEAIRGIKSRWKSLSKIGIEDKANGSAVIDTLKRTIPGIEPIEPEGGKESRVMAAAPFIESGNLWLSATDPQSDALVDEACSFPKGSHDDGIDMVAYAVNKMITGSELWKLEALSKGIPGELVPPAKGDPRHWMPLAHVAQKV